MSLINEIQRAALQAACDDAQRRAIEANDELVRAEAVLAAAQAKLDDAQAECAALEAGLGLTPADATVVTDPLDVVPLDGPLPQL
jgi:predicted  nucleic acid-binding Zn-ribbon protein